MILKIDTDERWNIMKIVIICINAARRSKFAQETHVRHQLRCVEFQSSNLIPSMGLFLAKNSFLPLEGAISTLSFRKYTRKQFSIRCMFPVNFKALAQIASEIIGGSQKNDKVEKNRFFRIFSAPNKDRDFKLDRKDAACRGLSEYVSLL